MNNGMLRLPNRHGVNGWRRVAGVDRRGGRQTFGQLDSLVLRMVSELRSIQPMRTRIPSLIVAVLFAALTFSIQTSAQADTFGGGDPDEFTIDFVQISNTDNAEDNTGYGAVSYEYRVGKYEISRLQITKAKELGMIYVSSSGPSDNHPEAQITWYKAAWFVNWLNTSTGHQAAYDLTYTNASYSMKLWRVMLGCCPSVG
jgi:hypothetical protein